ncbi:MAG TPA: transcriptional regulator [Verrucomicrobiae bacterium]|nr:transcriptional regulator [Verrucomicrobiae bacterium]
MTNKGSRPSLADLASHVETFRKLEQVIHVKGRLSIISVLAATESLPFTELRDLLSLTDGNLAAHLVALNNAGYIRMVKRGANGKPLTFISLTAAGRNAFTRYLEGLERIVKRHR